MASSRRRRLRSSSGRKGRLEQQAQRGQRGATVALALAENPNRFLSTVQVGITLISTLAAAFGGARLAEVLTSSLQSVALLAPYASSLALGIDAVRWHGYTLEVLDMDGQRIDKILIRPPHHTSEEQTEGLLASRAVLLPPEGKMAPPRADETDGTHTS